MEAKKMFREGWIMLLRPFDFGNLSRPLQKLTILYAYSEKPLISKSLNKEGKEMLDDWERCFESKGAGMFSGGNKLFIKQLLEEDDEYEKRMERHYDYIFNTYSTQENYEGQLVQSVVEQEMCRFYPGEYSIISNETFQHLLQCSEDEYQIEIENEMYFDIPEIKEKIFYIRSRCIKEEVAIKMACMGAKESVIFRPQPAMLEMFCREHEIY